MLFAASVVYFDKNRSNEAIEFIKSLQKTEVYQQDLENGKVVIVIEGEDNKEIEEIENIICQNSMITDLEHYAFHFGEEVESMLSGAKDSDINFEDFFKKKRKQ